MALTATQKLGELSVRQSEDQVIIALDFGTTFSGIAFAFAQKDRAKPACIMNWPGLEGYSQPKIDTLISYDPKDTSSFTWGAAHRHKHQPIVGMKLLLDPDQERPLFVPQGGNSSTELRRLGKTAVDVASDYIGEIYAYALSKIQSTVPKEYFDDCDKIYVVSVPAVWSPKAKDSTLRAAKMAGIHPVSLITEPEAAALYTVHHMENLGLSVGDAIVICDAGGGTVDLTSYEIGAIKPRLELRELVPPKGGMSGSLVLNRRFEEKVKEIVGEEEFVALKKKPGWTNACNEFDRQHKKAYRGMDDENFYVNFTMAKLADDPENNLEDSCWHMTGKDMRQIFAPLITEIMKLVDEQVNLIQVKRMEESHPKGKEIKAILLVGGFGSNEYLKQCLEKKHTDIQVIQPVDAWAAIVQGACLSKLPQEAVVRSSIATKHYGVSATFPYDALDDVGQEKIWDQYDEIYRCKRMQWYIYQGEDLERGTENRVAFPFYRSLAADFTPDMLIFRDHLICCDSIGAPRHPKQGITQSFVSLNTDLRGVSKDNFKMRRKKDGSTYYEVHYSLCLTTISAGFTFSLEIDGETKGSVEHKFE